jgi:DNA-binding MarR family transcriptional regulator
MAITPSDEAPTIEFPSTSFLVSVLALRWNAQLGEELKPLGITPPGYAVLAHLRVLTTSGTTPNQRELADASHLEPMHVSKLARALEQAGLVTRARNPADPREFGLTITEHGDRTLNRARQIAATLEHQRLAAVGGPSSDQATQLKTSLVLLLDQAEHTPRREPPDRTQRATAQGTREDQA